MTMTTRFYLLLIRCFLVIYRVCWGYFGLFVSVIVRETFVLLGHLLWA